jgi:anti-anti-sigma regulatory factor
MIEIATGRNLDTGITTLRLDGELTPATVAPIRTSAGKAAAECPTAVLLDLSGLRHAEPSLLSVFATATIEARENWGVPVLLCAPGAEVRRGLGLFRSCLAVYDTYSHASLAVHANVPSWIRKRLTPAPASARIARNLVGDACTSWDLPALRDGARLVASEMASNAIKHAGTDFDVTVSFTGAFLRIAIRDGSRNRPELRGKPPVTSTIMPTGGRGLYIIGSIATHCGHLELPDGKIVWALMRARPSAGRDEPER